MELPPGLERIKQENPRNLTSAQLEARKNAIEEQMTKYPNLSPTWVQWLWNYLSTKTEEECEELVNAGELK